MSLDRAFNMAAIGLELLYELALDGSRAAGLKLKTAAEQVSRSAAEMQEFWDRD